MGIYGYPPHLAARIALRTVADHLVKLGTPRLVRFVLYSDDTYQRFADALGDVMEDAARLSDSTQPCISCGRDTAAGTGRFASRKRGRDTSTGKEGFLCYACQPGSARPGADSRVPLSGRYVLIDMPGGYPG